jgi:hypothetical protein
VEGHKGRYLIKQMQSPIIMEQRKDIIFAFIEPLFYQSFLRCPSELVIDLHVVPSRWRLPVKVISGNLSKKLCWCETEHWTNKRMNLTEMSLRCLFSPTEIPKILTSIDCTDQIRSEWPESISYSQYSMRAFGDIVVGFHLANMSNVYGVIVYSEICQHVLYMKFGLQDQKQSDHPFCDYSNIHMSYIPETSERHYNTDIFIEGLPLEALQYDDICIYLIGKHGVPARAFENPEHCPNADILVDYMILADESDAHFYDYTNFMINGDKFRCSDGAIRI